MKTNDYVKYMTQTLVKYADQPKDERKRLREERKQAKASFWYRWFGILPYIFYIEVKNRRKKSRSRLMSASFLFCLAPAPRVGS